MRYTPEYRAWIAAKTRCQNTANKDYASYGGRGIRLCDRWQNFEAFYEDMGPRPSSRHSLERQDVHGPYDAQNCIWALPKIQCRNKRNNRHLTAFGLTLTMAEWAERQRMTFQTLRQRIDYFNWPVELALTTPVRIWTPRK